VLAEMTLAHELTHALEDQQFELQEPTSSDDVALARTSLIEGTATWLMSQYLLRYFSSEEALGSLLGSALQDTGDLPPFLESQVVFPYVGGETFVDELHRRAGGRWALVDTAYKLRMPASTEQIIHPEAYLDADAPMPVRLRVGPVLGGAWERATAGTWGEFQTRELIAQAGGNSFEAAAGWGGDRYELWQDGDENVLVMRWRWDTPRDEREFVPALREWAESKLEHPYVIADRDGAVTLVVAPDQATADRVAARA
jgi:hypothetical protein